MKVIVSPQAFKGTASAKEAAEAMRRGILLAMPHARVITMPIADGGSGTVEALVSASGGHYIDSPTWDPLGRPITARWGVLNDRETAVIESSAASGLSLLSQAERDPTVTTTKGTGVLIRAALDLGCHRLLIGLGDSATNDGGVGMAQAIGIRAMDETWNDLPDGGAALINLHAFDLSGAHSRLYSSSITVLCDVGNTLCGLNGSSVVFGPQKGATSQQISLLDAALTHFADIVEEQFKRDVRDIPGTGASGGMGAGLLALCGAIIRPGFEVIADTINIREQITGADLVITGEGCIDTQTTGGKGVAGIAALSRECGVPLVAAIVGRNNLGPMESKNIGIDEVFAITHPSSSVIPSAAVTCHLIEASAESVTKKLLKERQP